MKTREELEAENARLEEWKKSAEALLKDYRDFEVTQHTLEAENARLQKEYQNSDQDNMRLQQALDAERGQSNARLQKWQRSEKENARLQSEVERLTPRVGERGESPSVPCRCGQHRVVVSTTGNGKTTRHGWGPDDCGPKVPVR